MTRQTSESKKQDGDANITVLFGTDEHGNRAYYMPAMDLVWLPSPNDFESYEHYLATALHELAHWSGAKHRLDRQLNNRFGTKAYAAEELVAELSAAFLCAHRT